ncbi:hypothetical protein EV175_002448 [Coemansia sp. RSA 1933]|nr:hypothetical protein EV175_002448 [Coemansia sp. RSA 1933]
MLTRAGLFGSAKRPLPMLRSRIAAIPCRSLRSQRNLSTDTAKQPADTDTTKPPAADNGSPKERPPGTYAIWAMEAIGATAAFLYYLHLHTDILKPKVTECLTPEQYTGFTLLEKEPLTSDTTRFRFRVNRPRFDGDREKLVDSVRESGVWAVDVKDHLVQTFRTYTPMHYHVAQTADDETGARHGYLDLVVKRYPRGSLSRFLHDTRVGDQVEMRGPVLSWPYEKGKYGSVYMVAGGTGIAPMFQLIERTLEDPEDKDTTLHLLYGSPSHDHVIYRQKLDALVHAHPDRLHIHYLVDQQLPADVMDPLLHVGHPDKHSIARFAQAFDSRRDVMLVCGPDPMLASVCGTRPINAGQGLLAGALKELGFPASRVFKF